MALGMLMILFLTISVLAIIGIVLMLTVKNERYGNVIFVLTSVFSLVITYLHVTSLPSNWYLNMTIAYVLGLLTIVALILKFVLKKHEPIAKYLVILSIIGGIIGTFF